MICRDGQPNALSLLLGVRGRDEYGEIIKKSTRDVNITMKFLMTAYNSHPIDCVGE